MKIITSLDTLKNLTPQAFTIGTFDGVHIGHQALFTKLRETQKPFSILTFSTHPLQTLQPKKPLSFITPLSIKLSLLEAEGFESAIVLPFSSAFANLSFDELLEMLPLSHLILGKEAVFGKGRQGTELNVKNWAESADVSIEYIEKTKIGRETVSSRRIRDAIKMGDLLSAERLLGRPHLLLVPANSTRFSVSGLCMPPDGSYLLNQNAHITLSSSPEGRFITLNTPLPEETLLSFNPTSTISLRGVHVF